VEWDLDLRLQLDWTCWVMAFRWSYYWCVSFVEAPARWERGSWVAGRGVVAS
jgi:hypothetical protein